MLFEYLIILNALKALNVLRSLKIFSSLKPLFNTVNEGRIDIKSITAIGVKG